MPEATLDLAADITADQRARGFLNGLLRCITPFTFEGERYEADRHATTILHYSHAVVAAFPEHFRANDDRDTITQELHKRMLLKAAKDLSRGETPGPVRATGDRRQVERRPHRDGGYLWGVSDSGPYVWGCT